ncbi:MAG: MBL fold metallo-hydrolase [Planctomycetota bacterium]
MELIIHRGAKEIGGSCVELRSQGHRLILDFGLPLTDDKGQPFKLDRCLDIPALIGRGVLPDIPNFYCNSKPDPNITLVISHAHQDHYGLARYVHPEVSKYVTKGTLALLTVSCVFLPNPVILENTKRLSKKLDLKPFLIETYPVDHSAPDAVALSIKVEGKTVIYTGDFRAGGPRNYLFARLKQDLPRGADFLLLEGTMLSRDNEPEYSTEHDVYESMMDIFKKKSNVAFVFCSPQNLNRIVSIYKAAKHSDCLMVIDYYTALTLHLLKDISKNLPQYDHKIVRVIKWETQRKKLTTKGHDFSDFADKVDAKSRITMDEIICQRKKIVLLTRSNSTLDVLIKRLPPQGLTAIWSMWEGYWKTDCYARSVCKKHGITDRKIHASGHASRAHLQELLDAVKPKSIIPIHTQCAQEYPSIFSNHSVRCLKDGEWLNTK